MDALSNAGARYRAVVFDFDGTLADTRDAIAACMTETFTWYGLEQPSSEALRATIGATLPDSLIALGAPPAEVDSWVRTYRDLYIRHGLEGSRRYPGVLEVVSALRRQGCRHAVVSNKGNAALTRFLADAGLGSVAIFAGDTTRFTKPDPRLMNQEILAGWPDLEAPDVLVVGDTETDIEFARATGAAVCWVSYGYGDPGRCRRLAPDYTVDSLRDVLALAGASPATSGG